MGTRSLRSRFAILVSGWANYFFFAAFFLAGAFLAAAFFLAAI
jgi:hypothetical protein